MAKKTVDKGILLRRKLKKGQYPSEVIGYFIQSDRQFVRDEMGRMRNLYDKYIAGKAIEKKINTFDATGLGAYFIDFTDFKPKVKKPDTYKKMQDIIKKAAKAGVISSGMAKSLKVGKVIAPVVDGKIEPSGLYYEELNVKPFVKSRKKPKTIAVLAKEIYDYLDSLGYCISDLELTAGRLWTKIFQNGKTRTKVKKTSYRTFLLRGGEWWIVIENHGKNYTISFKHETAAKHTNEHFHSSQMIFDDADKKTLVGMLGRLGIKPRRKQSRKGKTIQQKASKSKDTKTKVTTIVFGGKKFSITGTIPGMKRDDFIKKVERLGGTFQNHITKDTDLLIIGNKPGKGKIEKAKKYKIMTFKIKDAFTF